MTDELREAIVECPFDDCSVRFDAVSASFVGADKACPGCGATWKQLCAAVEPGIDPENVEIKTNHDGTTEIVEAAQ